MTGENAREIGGAEEARFVEAIAVGETKPRAGPPIVPAAEAVEGGRGG